VDREASAPATDEWFGMDPAMLSRDPSPDDAVAVLEELELLMRDLDPVHRKMVEMRLQGYSTTEIAAACDRSRQMVALVFRQVHERLSKRL
jgi:DNA-directed RNA polymerase specialized sigma24 family protein